MVVSLIYLGVQIRAGARAAQAETEMEAARMWSEFHGRVAHSPDMARIWDLGHTDSSDMSDLERQRFVWLVAEYFFLVEGLFKQRERGFISPGTWAAHERTVAGVLENEFVAGWWKSGVSPYSEAFVRHIDSLFEKPVAAKWSYSPLAELGAEADNAAGRPGEA